MVVSIAPLLPAPFASDAMDDQDEAGIREAGASSLCGLESPFCLQRPDTSTGAELFRSIRL